MGVVRAHVHQTGSVYPANSPCLTVDDRGVILDWNEAAQELLGYSWRQILGRPVTVLFADGEASAAGGGFPGGPTGKGSHGQVVLRHCDGHLVSCYIGRICAEAGGNGAFRWRIELTGEEERFEGETAQAVLEALFTQSPLDLFVLDADLRLIRFNPSGDGVGGISAEGTTGRRPQDVWPWWNADVMDRVCREVLDTGQPVINLEKRSRPPHDPTREHVFSASVFRLQDSEGRVLGVADMAIDVTERYRAQQRLALLAQASASIGTTLDVLHTAQELADAAVGTFADDVCVDILDSVLRGEELSPGPPHLQAVLRRAALRSTDGHCHTVTGTDRTPHRLPITSPLASPLSDLRPRMATRLDTESGWLGQGLDWTQEVKEAGVHSAVAVPLVVHGVVLGIAHFFRSAESEPFEQDDLTLAMELVSRTAVCVDNARRFTAERNTVLALQRSLLPSVLPAQSAVEVAHSHIPVGAGGAWFDVIPLSGARVALVVGKAMGHGIHAVAATGRMRAAVRTLADMDLAPDEVLARLDIGLTREDREPDGGMPEPKPAHGDGAAGSTCLYIVYDPVARSACVASAGHPAPVLVYPDGAAETFSVPLGPALGTIDGDDDDRLFHMRELDLPEGTLLGLHTESLLDNVGRTPEGAVAAALNHAMAGHPRRPVQDIGGEVVRALLPTPPQEDVALLIARTRVLGSDRVNSWDLPNDPAVVATARSLVAGQLDVWGLEDLTFTAQLIVSELVTNAIRYGSPPVRLKLLRDAALICEVSDTGNATPRLRHARTTDEGGRGLFLISQVAGSWGTRGASQGKTIWAALPLPGDSSPAPMPE
ncbi:SpoIIE family protein phosphatase [Streptomyces sp. PSKA30]|uniref:SpoIIE family protein phosphatase n=1 Tax=Streptomyces sp. PSKA30 TaxID=2874597 RepID=UPI001CD0FA28|nr:SpoIIE family protein phosphatase [Streptomyces sp. PSKA30]MBZ9645026.1 SpoIIE family protein phosphatase [Streptomyces sp. PSKA30]